MASLLSTNSLVTSVPRSSSSFLSRLPIRRLPDARRRSLAGIPRRISARDRRRGRKGRSDGGEVMASSSRASPPPLWRSEKGGSASVVGYDEEEALRTTDTSNSGYRSGKFKPSLVIFDCLKGGVRMIECLVDIWNFVVILLNSV